MGKGLRLGADVETDGAVGTAARGPRADVLVKCPRVVPCLCPGRVSKAVRVSGREGSGEQARTARMRMGLALVLSHSSVQISALAARSSAA